MNFLKELSHIILFLLKKNTVFSNLRVKMREVCWESLHEGNNNIYFLHKKTIGLFYMESYSRLGFFK